MRDVVKDIFLPWYNAFRFFMQNIQQRKVEKGVEFRHDDSTPLTPTNTMDRWILSFQQSLVKFVHQEMKGGHQIASSNEIVCWAHVASPSLCVRVFHKQNTEHETVDSWHTRHVLALG